MNRAPSKPAATTKRAQPKPHPKVKTKNQSPLKDLNAGVVFKTKSGTCSSSSSTKPTADCLPFRFSNSSSSSNSFSNATNHHRSDCNAINPRNAIITKPRLRSCKPLNQGRKIRDRFTDATAERVLKVDRLRQCQTISLEKVVSDERIDFLSRSRRVQKAGKSGKDFEFTPLGCKAGSLEVRFDKAKCSSSSSICDKNDDGSGNTPPAEATVSPEIQCGTTVMSIATPVCFGAGHVLSGVSDKRKYRPRGVLIVGANCNVTDGLNISNEDLDGIVDVDGGCALVPPLPEEASVHWLLSPCDEDYERNGDSELLTSVHLQSSLSDSSDVSKDKNAESFRNPLVSPRKSISFQCLLESPSDNMASTSLDSPTCTTPNDEGIVSWFDEKIYSNLAGQKSSCSKDSLGSENLMQTPESYSSLERHSSQPLHHADNGMHDVDPKFDSAVEGLDVTSFSSGGQVSERFDSSFKFDCHLKSASSIEFNHLQYNWDKSSWISDAIEENEKCSHFRISRTDELLNHLVEMDDSDCCKCLSDEVDKTDHYSPRSASPKDKLPEIGAASLVKKDDVKSAGCMNRNQNSIIQKNIQCAESISLDGGSLASSGDSGWDMCYKNNLFQVE